MMIFKTNGCIQFQMMLILFAFLSANSQDINPIKDYKSYIENEHVIGENKLAGHGLAGDDSWYSKPQEKYQIKGHTKHVYRFYLIPFKKGTKEDFIAWSKLYANQN